MMGEVKEDLKELMSGPIDGELTQEEQEIFDKLDKSDSDMVVEEQTPETKEVKKGEDKKEKVEVKAAPEEKKDEPQKEKEEITQEKKDQLEVELDKPYGQEDLKEFSEKEKAYFWSMRRDRQKRQEAQTQADILRLENARLKQKIDAIGHEDKKEEPEEDIFKDRQDDDFLTVQEARKLMAKVKPGESKPDPVMVENIKTLNRQYLAMCDKEAASMYDDYAEVSEVANDILSKNPAHIERLQAAMKNGENPAIVMYHIVKSSDEYDKLVPVAQAKLKARGIKTPMINKQEKVEKVEKQIEEAKQQPKTSAHVGGGNTHTASDEMTIEDVTAMSDVEFAKLPKATREKLLRKLGV